MKKCLKTGEEIKVLANLLEQCKKVKKLNMANHKESWALAHAFSDLEESFEKFLQNLLPKLIKSNPKEICDILLEIGEEFRHIEYHIRDLKFYRYLRN